MDKNNLNNIDILDNIDLSELNNNKQELNLDIEQETNNEIQYLDIKETIENKESLNINNLENENNNIKNINNKDNYKKTVKLTKKSSIFGGFIFLIKYILTSGLIFGVLLISTNYSAYYTIAKSHINKGELETKKHNLMSSVEAASIKEKFIEKKKKEIEVEKNENETEVLNMSIKKMKKEENKKNINLDIEITPYENRIIIPKIGKNIPLIDIKNQNIKGQKELDNIFMKELENGVIRYPGSALPGEEGNTFIFGHSSNFPWMKGDYNDIFALLDKVVYNDEIIVYYGQKKYVYKIREKKVITPGDVSVLERNKKKSEITLMTCRPIGTTLNRLIVVGDLIE